ncbi:SusD/RagB family nutrient-binding outer membrane lipoprotein [Chitinophaga agrisoli]|uniref:SusD/RagB family nutrient-binding outer membrane lipoprotein n=1 Tax=Chitinophaga agrisoli TaxID=2607653 RepID=A0A5B2VUC0_9BACT|nr:RagB/SusD family nutrient uptake outer membrane protein [Chitinophaga agrisoli]KAA2241826.1 SusD/RagB family nutrient-binding outer membrane lipoprotein [Chitinophaga agrisoli]
MNKISFKYKTLALVAMAALLGASSCTKNYEDYNTDPTGLTEDQLKPDFNYIGGFFPQIQSSIYFNFNNTTADYQLQQNLNADVYSGYMMSPNPFRSNISNLTYALVDGWNGSAFALAYNRVMSPIQEVKRRGADKVAPDFWGVALILKVEAMHRVTDIYGPIPYTQYGQGGSSSVYDSQETIYKAFFQELDVAIANLKAYIAAKPGATPFAKFDMLYGGDYKQWIKFANSLRLRLATRVNKIAPALAKTEGEKALADNGGLLENNNDNALVSGFGIKHPLFTITNKDAWSDISMGASMDVYLNGFHDPRIGKYFDPASDFAGQYKGIRIGSDVPAKPGYAGFSTLAYATTKTFRDNTPLQLMTAAEVFFLRAEAALNNWANPGGTAQDLYERGITTSLTQWGVADQAAEYINDAVSKPIPYVDPKTAANNAPAPSAITIKWDEAATPAVKLERIITQKWIAIFPEGEEAWAEFRRTGYPKLLTVVNNRSNNTIDTDKQIRRLAFPQAEYLANQAEVQKAIQLLGGPDNGGTRLWWDTRP